MEDLRERERYRLAVPGDVESAQTMKNVARWYKTLHQKGREFVAKSGTKMYSELDCLTRENLRFIGQKTGTAGEVVWHFLDEHCNDLLQKLSKVPKTLTYNDFYYTNLAVARDGTSALMFDYNLLGQGMAASDVRNVTYALSEKAKNAFLREYGPIDPKEALLDQVMGTLTALYTACLRETMPPWVEEELAKVGNGSLLTSVKAFLLQ